jgi:hypothetical protein
LNGLGPSKLGIDVGDDAEQGTWISVTVVTKERQEMVKETVMGSVHSP